MDVSYSAGCTTNDKVKEEEVCTERSLCSVQGCTTLVVARICSAQITVQAVCAKHGANGLCSAPGCTSNARAGRGVCQKHGANGICAVEGCTSGNAPARGVCSKHSKRGLCSALGCTNNTQARGVCGKHDAKGLCSAPWCTSNARARGGGVCHKHMLGPLCFTPLLGGAGNRSFLPQLNLFGLSPQPPPHPAPQKAWSAGYSAGADEFTPPSASEIQDAREYARSTATAAVQHAKLSMERDRLAVEAQTAAEKEAAVTEAAALRRVATYVKKPGVKKDKNIYYTAEVLGLAKNDRDRLIAKLMLTELEKVELIQAVRRFKQLASQKRYLAKQKVKEMAKAAANANAYR